MANYYFIAQKKLAILFVLLFFALGCFANAPKKVLFSSKEALVVSQKVVLCTTKDETQKTNIEENDTTLYINPNTTIVGLDYLGHSTKITKKEKEQDKLYIIENTTFFSSQDLVTVTIVRYDEFQKNTQNKKHKVSKENLIKVKERVVKAQNNSQVAQSPFPFSLPTDQKQTIVTAISTTVTPSTFSKTISKTFVIHNCFSLSFRKSIYKRQFAICYNENSKPFQVETKHCNRPPPVSYC